MPKALERTVLADASDARVQQVEGNVYFPLDAVRQDFLRPSETQTVCPWKGSQWC